MACIYKRGKTWSYSVDLGRDESGKRKKKGKGGFRTQKEAKDAAAILEAELANGIFVDEKKVTFGELADQWLAEHSKNIKPTSQYIYQFSIKKLKIFLDKVLVKDITKVKYQKVLNELFKKNLSKSSLSSIHTSANMIFKYACQYDILKSNPAEYAKIPKAKITLENSESETALPKYLEKCDLRIFLQTIKEHEKYLYYVIFMTLAYTGMRRGELGAMKWDDIDFKEKTINIRKTLYVKNYNMQNYELLTPKTKSSKRIIPVTDELLRELMKLRSLQREEQMRHRSEWHDANFVFTSTSAYGYPVYFSVTGEVMKKNLIRAGLPENLSHHSLRHTHTSLLAEAGVSLEAIMERLGHANDTITRTIYLHITKDVKKDAAQKFQKLMNSISG